MLPVPQFSIGDTTTLHYDGKFVGGCVCLNVLNFKRKLHEKKKKASVVMNSKVFKAGFWIYFRDL